MQGPLLTTSTPQSEGTASVSLLLLVCRSMGTRSALSEFSAALLLCSSTPLLALWLAQPGKQRIVRLRQRPSKVLTDSHGRCCERR